MALPDQTPQSLGERMQSIPKQAIYAVLILCASIPLFFDVTLPNKPVEPSIDFYGRVMAIPEGGRVLIGSDWTKGTRGESMGEMEAVLKILMRHKIKFGVYSTGDPQAPQVSRDTIAEVSADVQRDGYAPYKPFEDYVILGYYPNGDGTNATINNDVTAAFKGKMDSSPTGPQDVMNSPVFAGVKSVSDFNALILITPSSTERSTIERVKKTPLLFMVTGVMVPEDQVYYSAGQLKGLVGGVKGVFDMETLMEKGISPHSAPDNKGLIKSDHFPDGVPGFPGKHNAGKGTAYYLTLHFTLSLLVIAVLVGNIGMFLSRRRKV
jgi:hypothetical protein